MTSIAYRDGVMAADTQVTSGNLIFADEKCRKIIVLEKHGVIIGFAGAVGIAMAAVRQLDRLHAMPWVSGKKFVLEQGEGDNICDLFVVNWEGRIFTFEFGHWFEIHSPYYFAGSGSTSLNTAMRMGASAVEAIETTMKVDTGTGGEIITLKVSDLRKPERSAKPRVKLKISVR